jgi:preprotein translocase subunit SecE
MGTSPAKFVDQVKQEGSKVTWPSRKETLITTGMVLFMTVLAALFFLFVDWVISSSVRFILGV